MAAFPPLLWHSVPSGDVSICFVPMLGEELVTKGESTSALVTMLLL